MQEILSVLKTRLMYFIFMYYCSLEITLLSVNIVWVINICCVPRVAVVTIWSHYLLIVTLHLVVAFSCTNHNLYKSMFFMLTQGCIYKYLIFMHFQFVLLTYIFQPLPKGCIGVKFLWLTMFLSYISECCTGPGQTENLALSVHSDGGWMNAFLALTSLV